MGLTQGPVALFLDSAWAQGSLESVYSVNGCISSTLHN